jgi:putative FmdB family regulatory protein
MPIYEYVASTDASCPHCVDRFEVVQTLLSEPLKSCPECGSPVQKLFSAPAVQGAGRSAELLSNKSLAEKGFTKYVKAGGGAYEKVAGKGPKVIQKG